MSSKCLKCAGWEYCPIRSGEFCNPVRKVRRGKKHEFDSKNKRDKR